MLCLASKIACTAVVCAFAGAAVAQNSNTYRSQPHEGRSAVAGFDVEHALTREHEGITFFTVPSERVRQPDGSPAIHYIARRAYRGSDGTSSVTWADSQSCSAIRNLLGWLTELTPPSIEIAGISYGDRAGDGRRPRGYPVDGWSTRIWGRGTQPDGTALTEVEVRSNGGLIAEFGGAARQALSTCWTEEQPSVDARD